jgi:hypothetical protein
MADASYQQIGEPARQEGAVAGYHVAYNAEGYQSAQQPAQPPPPPAADQHGQPQQPYVAGYHGQPPVMPPAYNAGYNAAPYGGYQAGYQGAQYAPQPGYGGPPPPARPFLSQFGFGGAAAAAPLGADAPAVEATPGVASLRTRVFGFVRIGVLALVFIFSLAALPSAWLTANVTYRLAVPTENANGFFAVCGHAKVGYAASAYAVCRAVDITLPWRTGPCSKAHVQARLLGQTTAPVYDAGLAGGDDDPPYVNDDDVLPAWTDDDNNAPDFSKNPLLRKGCWTCA